MRRLFRNLVPEPTRRRWRAKRKVAGAKAKLWSFPRHPDAPRHVLPGRLVVSLTSYPGRFATLHLTCKSLLDQTVKPDVLVLWIAQEDMAVLPPAVRRLERHGLTIRACEDLRNFKKIIPTLLHYPDAFVATVDDDIFYPDAWLERLVGAYDPLEPTVVCYRAHRLAFDEAGALLPYGRWEWSVWDEAAAQPSRDLLPTGVGGVLYPPGSLPPMTTDLTLVRRLSATSDDVWLFFMWHTNGWSVRRVRGKQMELTEWPNSQATSLFALHRGGKKDEHLADMAAYFGKPLP